MKISSYLFLLLVCILLTALCSCTDNSPFHVTYSVSIDSHKPHRVLVHYKDSTDYVTIHIDKDWTKEVCLANRDIASLLIVNEQSPENYCLTDLFTNQSKVSLKGQIQSGEKTVAEYGENVVTLHLFK